MSDTETTLKSAFFTDEFKQVIDKLWWRRSRILVLVDGQISVLPEPGRDGGPSTAFGISTAIATLRNFSCGFSSFSVTVATRNGVSSPVLIYPIHGFRFSDAALSQFDQVWLFGENPGNLRPNSLDPADDALIAQGNPLSDDELAALARWMDGGGGVFAAGDHHLLGASMCHRVPRVAMMRRWTISDGVSTRDNETRFDTNRPATGLQRLGIQVIPEAVEMDWLPQRIEWVPFGTNPHALLSHPALGPIDVLPDHMHEGACFDFDDPSWKVDKRDLAFSFAGYSNDQFPKISGNRPLPQVVAWGTTLADPPLMFQSGDQPRRRFPQIAAYDGQAIGIGRVVVDSTWHHWFDMNLAGMEKRARETGGRSIIDRILRYYLNVGIYLASPAWRAGQFLGSLKAAQLGYFGLEQVDLSAPAAELGRNASAYLRSEFGPVWVRDFVLDQIRAVDEDICRRLEAKMWTGRPEPCALPVDLVERAVLGEIVRAVYSDMTSLREQVAQKGQVSGTPLLHGLYELMAKATARGLEAAIKTHSENLEWGRKELSNLRRQDRLDEREAPGATTATRTE